MTERGIRSGLEIEVPLVPRDGKAPPEERSVRVAFETARLELAQLYDESEENRIDAYRIACRHSAQTLQVARVSIWYLSEDGSELACLLTYDLHRDDFQNGARIFRRDCPTYFEAIQARRVVVAHDARNDPKTRELEQYLAESGVSSLLDSPIYRNGQVIGVVCHEHIGPPRHWTEKEAGFASAVSDMLTILGQQAERAELQAAIAAQRQLEAQNQKMQALTKLGLVVIHDLSNIMTIVSARASLLSEEPDLQQASRDLTEALNYGNNLLRQLREFYNAREPSSGVDAIQVLRAMEPSIRAVLGKGISLSFFADQDLAFLSLTRVEVEQLVMNLCMNAQDALAGRPGGNIAIRAERKPDRLVLVVRDNGAGMSESTQARLFEPYYSTKNGHSGIGLAAVFGIVSRAGGQIEVDSALERGTTFKVTFPLRAPPSFEPPWSL